MKYLVLSKKPFQLQPLLPIFKQDFTALESGPITGRFSKIMNLHLLKCDGPHRPILLSGIPTCRTLGLLSDKCLLSCTLPGLLSSKPPGFSHIVQEIQEFSPLNIRPFLKAGPRQNTTKQRRERVSAILTNTPVKNALEEDQHSSKTQRPKKEKRAKSKSRKTKNSEGLHM
ncbi:hypothetical protein N1851_026949 [Merluccius polli]|uniref:Uncharacterized protein n=1 Tax=Merluccius polli TaxID=89951 RepID=A0AA47NSK5_MERPO|nr:hypothetical protein N1851_026949 [Merluccius polli]